MTGIFLRKEIRTYTQERLWETQEVMAVYKPDRSFRMKPTLLTFWYWITYYPPNWKGISLFYLSHPSLWYLVIAAAVKSLQSCLTLCDPIDGCPPGSRPWDSPGKNTGVGCHFLLQCMKVKGKSLSRVRLFATLWTAAYQAPPSMGFSRQEYWSGVPLPSPSL